jgi:hypothetical protein
MFTHQKHIKTSINANWAQQISVNCPRCIISEMDVLLLVICNSVKMGIRLCYKWEKPE